MVTEIVLFERTNTKAFREFVKNDKLLSVNLILILILHFTINAIKSHRQTQCHFATRVRGWRAVRLELIFAFFMRASESEMQASNSSRLSTFPF